MAEQDDGKPGGHEGAPPPNPAPAGRINLQVQADEAVAKGVYSNSVMVNLNENEVTLDFIYVPPQSALAHLRSRVILSPRQAKQLVRVLSESMARYEQRFGAIVEPRRRDPILH